MAQKFKVVGAKDRDFIAIQNGNNFFVRTPYDSTDRPIAWDGDSPEMMLAALFSKWDFEPVFGDVEIDENEAPILERVEGPNGPSWKVIEVVDMATGASRPI